MMQSYASAAKLRDGGPILSNGLESPKEELGSPPPRIVIGRPLRGGCQFGCALFSSFPRAHHAARKMTPSGTSPVVTRRHSAISSLRASATIIVLRVLPRPSLVRAWNH